VRPLRFLLYAVLAGLILGGLAVYLVPALTAPVVTWSDSALDLEWARRGEGIVTPVVSPHHPPKPGYIAFLSGVLAAAPEESAQRAIVGGAERRIVVVQSVLLWLGIAAASWILGRRLGARYGVLLYVILILSLRLRDSASTIMSEPLTAAILLPLAALLLRPPERAWTASVFGAASAVLFLVRPNAGAAILLLALVAIAVHRVEGATRIRRALPLLLGFALVGAPFWFLTRVPGDPFRGMSPAFITGSLDYGWTPPHPPPEPPPFVQVQTAIDNWQTTLTERTADLGRQLAWRALHGLLGTDYYDARWSDAYLAATTISRILAPLLVLAAIASILVVSFRGRAQFAKILGLTLLALLVAQGLVLGALPRLALPFLPALLLYGIAAIPGLQGRRRRLAFDAAFVLLVVFAAWQRQVLDWEWGRVEAAGVRLRLVIPRGRLPAPLPEHGPATLHVRIAPLVLPTGAGLEVRSETGELLFSSSQSDYDPAGAFLSVLLPESILGANRQRDVTLTLVSIGAYDAAHFLLFPVIPPPWSAESARDGSAWLSPATGIARGALDWWAHPGLP
jgi:hypothetical protein